MNIPYHFAVDLSTYILNDAESRELGLKTKKKTGQSRMKDLAKVQSFALFSFFACYRWSTPQDYRMKEETNGNINQIF